jgi:SAM-dependent methyltransferase
MTASYTQTKLGTWSRAREALTLYRFLSTNMEKQVGDFLTDMRGYQSCIEKHFGAPLRDKTIYEIGCGQLLKNARFFGARNQVVAVDLDEIASSWSLSASWNMLRKNGPMRLLKTTARKIVGIDRSYIAELTRQMPATANARIKVLQRDAANSGLESEAFDCAVSFSVFEHLPEPRRVLKEIARLLRPGGVAFHVIHCFTSDSGAHDVRSFVADRSNLPYWCHLRPDKAHLVSSNTYVNRLSISQWTKLLNEELPGAEIVSISQGHIPRLFQELPKLQAAGELTEYSSEELMTVALEVSWVKPKN